MKKRNYIKTSIASAALYTLATFGAVSMNAAMAHAMTPQTTTAQSLAAGDFVQKSKRLKGSYKVVQENGQTIIRFSDNFRTTNGPDLKVFLSPQNVNSVSGQTATNGAVLLGLIKSTKGTQDSVFPANVNIADFNSVLIHCEAFSVLWGGGNI